MLLELTKPEKIVSTSLTTICLRKYTFFCGPERLGQQTLLFRSMMSFPKLLSFAPQSTIHFAENTNLKLSYIVMCVETECCWKQKMVRVDRLNKMDLKALHGCHCIYFTEACTRKFRRIMHSWHYVHKTLGRWLSYLWAGKWILSPTLTQWASPVAAHLNLRRHLFAIRILSSKIKCLIRYDFPTFTRGLEYFDHKQLSVFFKTRKGKRK